MAGWAILVGQVVLVGVAAGTLLPPNLALAGVLLVEPPFVAAWALVIRHITRTRFGVALPRFENE